MAQQQHQHPPPSERHMSIASSAASELTRCHDLLLHTPIKNKKHTRTHTHTRTHLQNTKTKTNTTQQIKSATLNAATELTRCHSPCLPPGSEGEQTSADQGRTALLPSARFHTRLNTARHHHSHCCCLEDQQKMCGRDTEMKKRALVESWSLINASI
jgi:hypothetical protein